MGRDRRRCRAGTIPGFTQGELHYGADNSRGRRYNPRQPGQPLHSEAYGTALARYIDFQLVKPSAVSPEVLLRSPITILFTGGVSPRLEGIIISLSPDASEAFTTSEKPSNILISGIGVFTRSLMVIPLSAEPPRFNTLNSVKVRNCSCNRTICCKLTGGKIANSTVPS